MTSRNEWVVLEDRELEAIAAGAQLLSRRASFERPSSELPSIGLPRPALESQSGASGEGHADFGLS